MVLIIELFILWIFIILLSMNHMLVNSSSTSVLQYLTNLTQYTLLLFLLQQLFLISLLILL